MGAWPGMKQEFPSLDVVVCTPNDGGSTGLLFQELPMVGIGDLRKLLLSLIWRDELRATSGPGESETMQPVHLIHRVFNHRFPTIRNDSNYLTNPLLVVPESLQRACPEPLARLLSSLGRYAAPHGDGPTIKPGGHCLGNLLLTAASPRRRADWIVLQNGFQHRWRRSMV
jgi:2-phospho-L-lactate transferase/gluconeogenesis factor (CofD/UPF0052 family)